MASNAVPNALPGARFRRNLFLCRLQHTDIRPHAFCSQFSWHRLTAFPVRSADRGGVSGAGARGRALTAAGEAARALDPQALKAALAEPAQARSVLSALMASAGKLDTAALPPAGQRLVEALKGLQADADSLSDPARLKAAVEAVLGLAASAGGPMASSLSRKTGGVQRLTG
ncbi:hypothetical protein V6L77_22875 [Pannonibacter sp. Pt2-lr]